MTDPKPTASRREFLETAGAFAGASALAGVAIPSVHAAELKQTPEAAADQLRRYL